MLKELFESFETKKPTDEEREYIIDSLAEALARLLRVNEILEKETKEENVFFVLSKDGKYAEFELPYPIIQDKEELVSWIIALTNIMNRDFGIKLDNFGWVK